MRNRGLWIALAAGLALCIFGVDPALAIDRDCPKGQTWDPNQGSCVKKKKARRRSPAKKYYEAIEHIEGTAKRPRPERGVKLLQQACKAKHGPSCTLLGFLHLNGRAVTYNAIESLEFYQKACTQKDPNGCLGAAEIHSRGLLGSIDHAKAIPFLDSACKLKNGKGCYELALKYNSALGVKSDWRKANSLFKTAFTLNEAECAANAGPACYLAGESHFKGRGTRRNYTKSLAAFQRGCASGSGQACYWLGYSQRWGHGTKKDDRKALENFQKACQQYDNAEGCHNAGVVIAQGAEPATRTAAENKALMDLGERACKLDKRTCDLLAYLYATGKGGVKNQDLSTKWYLIGCDHGRAAACQSAAHRAFDGTGMKKDVPRALKMWQSACDLNWKDACADLGEHYFNGKVVKQDLRRAYRLFNTGCTRGDMDACHWVGWVKHKGKTGWGTKPDVAGAIRFYKKACDGDLTGACIDLGHLYKNGLGTQAKNPDEAKTWYDKACQKGHKKGCISLGDMHYRAEGVPKDPLKAALAYQRACKLGATQQCYWIDNLLRDARANSTQKKNALAALEAACTDKKNDDACVELARLYAWGGYIAGKNGRRAFSLYDAGCKRGVKMACVQLGHMYSNGIGVVKDIGKAKQLFTQQCNGAIPAACAWLGYQLYQEEKYKEAAPLFRKACDDGDMAGCTMIGYSHYTARGVSWDIAESRKAYIKGCDLGEAASCNNLGEMYENGISVDLDHKKARELFQKGCTPNAAQGCTNLARYYESGLEGDVDLKKAEALFLRGCEEAEWGLACLDLARFYEKHGKAKRSRIAALQQKALGMIRESAKENPYSRYTLGLLFRDGVATVKDAKKATDEFVASCEGYDPLGCMEAGAMLMGDKGVDANYEQAALHFDRACAAGLETGCKQAEVARTKKDQPATTTTDTPKVPLKPTSKKGCGCETGSSGGAAGLLVVLAGFLAVRRRAF